MPLSYDPHQGQDAACESRGHQICWGETLPLALVIHRRVGDQSLTRGAVACLCAQGTLVDDINLDHG